MTKRCVFEAKAKTGRIIKESEAMHATSKMQLGMHVGVVPVSQRTLPRVVPVICAVRQKEGRD